MEEISITAIGEEVDIDSAEFDSVEYVSKREEIAKNQASLPDLVVSDKYIYKRVRFRSEELESEDSLWRLWIPSTLTHEVIEMAHGTRLSCHSGFSKTYARVREKYYWPKMATEVKSYVSQCEVCKTTKAPNQTLRPPITKQIVSERPMQRLYVDLLGPYPRTKRGNTFIFIAVDHFSKYTFLKALPKATSTNIIRFLEPDVFHAFGTPEYVHSDNGKQFVSSEFAKFLESYGVQHIRTAFYSPQANISERVNRSILNKLRVFVRDEQDNWDSYLSSIACALRSDNHDSLGCQPYFAMFGQNMVNHGSAYKILRNLRALHDPELDVVPREAKIVLARQKLSENLQSAHERSKATYNTRSKPTSFRVGQEIFYRNFAQSNFAQGKNSKLLPKFIKARIRCTVGNCMYELETLAGKSIGVYHAKDIRQ